MSLPLQDLTIIEMGTFITGPATAVLLADLGANVIKVEQPETGDPFRAWDGDFYSPHFQTYNRNKKSVTLDTRCNADLARFDELIAGADVFIQNFRPGVADRIKVGAERLRTFNQTLIYCSISGFGAAGSDRERPAFDTVAQAASGFLRLLLNPAQPRVVGPALADALTGFYAALGILAALHEREISGKGKLIETSMFEAMCHFNLDDFTHLFSVGLTMDAFSRPRVSQSYVFECADGKWMALHMSSPSKFWESLARAVGHRDMLDRPEFASREARIGNYEQVAGFLAPIFRSRTRDEWSVRLRQEEVPHAPVNTSAEVAEGDMARELGLIVETEGPRGRFRSIRPPWAFDGELRRDVTAPPTIGQHNEEVLKRPQ